MKRKDFQIYKMQTFDSFCKRLIKNEVIDIQRKISHRAKHEIIFSELSNALRAQLAVRDEYDLDSWVFYAKGKIPIVVIDENLARALALLTPSFRDVILLYYFLDMTLTHIALLLDIPFSTAQYRYTAALVRLKEIMESFPNATT